MTNLIWRFEYFWPFLCDETEVGITVKFQENSVTSSTDPVDISTEQLSLTKKITEERFCSPKFGLYFVYERKSEFLKKEMIVVMVPLNVI